MDMNQMGLFRLMQDKMAWHNQRQEVLSQNVANANTPGYEAQDLGTFDFKAALRSTTQLQPVQTQPGHLASAGPEGGRFEVGGVRKPYETKPDGNEVVLEEQLMKVGQNSMEYQTITNLYRKQVGMLRTAISPPR